MNVDDWALVRDPINQANQSRPGWDLVYTYLFHNSFSPFFGWLIAGVSLYAIAAAVTLFSASVTGPWVCLLALLTSLHAYILDLFNFSFAIGLYLLPAALSLWGGVLMAYGPPLPLLGLRWLDWLLGVLMITMAMAIYQPTGYLGIALLGWHGLALALGQKRSFRPAAPWRLVTGVLLGGLLYYGWALLAMRGVSANERTGFADLPRFLEKITSLSVLREIYQTRVPLLPVASATALSLVFLGLLALASLWVARSGGTGRERRRRLGLLWASAGFLTLLPVLLFLILDAGFPSRAFCLGNFGIASFSVMVLATLSAGQGAGRRLSQAVVALLIVAYVIPQAAFASRVWGLVNLLERRDAAMAQTIVSDVRAMAARDGSASEPFKVFGTSSRNEPFPHWSSVGESAFRREWSIPAIFRELLGVKVEAIAYRSEDPRQERQLRSSLPACAAYPAAGSIVRYQGQWLVCLEPNPAAAAVPESQDPRP